MTEWQVEQRRALELLRELEDGAAGLVLTDPPYNVGLGYEKHTDEMRVGRYWSWMYQVVQEAERAVGYDGCLAVVTPLNQRRHWTGLLDELGLQEIKGSPVSWMRPNFGGGVPFGNGFDHATYQIHVLAGRGFEVVTDPPRSSGVTTHNYIEAVTPQSNFDEGRQHAAQQPVRVYEKIVLKCSRAGDLVLDPFAGSGTAGVAARRWGRRFRGSDTGPEAVETSRERIADTTPRTSRQSSIEEAVRDG